MYTDSRLGIGNKGNIDACSFIQYAESNTKSLSKKAFFTLIIIFVHFLLLESRCFVLMNYHHLYIIYQQQKIKLSVIENDSYILTALINGDL